MKPLGVLWCIVVHCRMMDPPPAVTGGGWSDCDTAVTELLVA